MSTYITADPQNDGYDWWQDLIERKTLDRQATELSHGMQRRHEAAKTFKKEIRAFKEYVLAGGNPHAIAGIWEQVKALE